MSDVVIRPAGPADAPAVAELLYAFNREYDDPTPSPAELTVRVRELLGSDETHILLAAATPAGPPHGLSVARLRRSIWTPGLECYLAELYVVPERRGEGTGRALLEATLALARECGADYIDLGTSEADVAARALYESMGFSCREGKPDGPLNFFYERPL